MPDVRAAIHLQITEDASNVLPRVSQAFENTISKIQKFRESFRDFSSINKELEDLIENIKSVQPGAVVPGAAGSGIIPTGTSKMPTPTSERSGVGNVEFFARIPRRLSTILEPLTQGRATESAVGLADFVGEISKKLGPLGTFVTGASLATAGVAVLGNILAKPYEQAAKGAIELAGAFGTLGTKLKDTSSIQESNNLKINEAMKKASEAASKFGYTLQEGYATQRALTRFGATQETAPALSEKVFAYARGYGIEPGSLTEIAGYGLRFRQGDVLGLVAGGLEASGMSRGRLQEYAESTLQLFEQSLSRGIVRSFEDITKTQNLFAQLGELWRGELGAQRLSRISGAMESATALQRTEDVAMYRAAYRLAGGDIIETRKILEKGVTAEFLSELSKELDLKDRATTVLRLSGMFGLKTAESESIYKLLVEGRYKEAAVKTAPPPEAASTVLEYQRSQEELQRMFREVGRTFYETKASFANFLADILGPTLEAFGVGESFLGADYIRIKKQRQEAREKALEGASKILEPGVGYIEGGTEAGRQFNLVEGFARVLAGIFGKQDSAANTMQEAAKTMNDAANKLQNVKITVEQPVRGGRELHGAVVGRPK